jgi:dihydrolipoamide dehydrogenase
LHSAEIYHGTKAYDELGVKVTGVEYDEPAVYQRKDKVVSTLRDGIRALVKAGKIDLYEGSASFEDGTHVCVNGQVLEGEHILVATGSSPATLPIKGIEKALTSDDVLASPVDGHKIVIIGGGVIGMEFASYFSATRKEVVVVEAMDKILPSLSKEISVQLGAYMKKNGVTIMASSKVTEIGHGFVKVDKGGVESVVDCDKVIVAIGRKANICGLHLEKAGVEHDRFIKVDSSFKTSADNVYAVGDVVGGVQLAHYASASAITAVENMLGLPCSVDLSVVPSCVYTTPEIAVVGASTGAKTGKFLLGANGRALINGLDRGYVKIVADENDVVIGGELFGGGVTEMVGEVALAIRNKLTIGQVAGTIHPHPTVYESVAEACEDVVGLSTHKK